MTTELLNIEDVKQLDRDLKSAAASMGVEEARFLVDNYYAMQDYRIKSANQKRALGEGGEPTSVVTWLSSRFATMERVSQASLGKWAAAQVPGQWAMSITGIGPVLAAGFLAHIDITKAPTAGHIWRFAGLDPTVQWNKGERRPWNARLKVLAWKAGESFVKVSNNDSDHYGHVYAARKQLETERNEAGEYADQAAAALQAKRYGAETDARKHYESGKLPPAHIHARAKRYAVKLFFSHLHHVMYEHEYGEPPPMPYIFSDQAKVAGLGNHTHYESPPNWPL